MLRYIQESGSYHKPGIPLVEENSKQANEGSNRSSISRPLLVDKLNREGLEGTGGITMRQTNSKNGERRQRHSAPDIFYGRTSEIEEMRRRHELAKQALVTRRYSGERRASLPVLELEQITEEEEDKIEAELNADEDANREEPSSPTNNRLPPIYENQRLNPDEESFSPPDLDSVDSEEIQLEFIRKPRARRKLSV